MDEGGAPEYKFIYIFIYNSALSTNCNEYCVQNLNSSISEPGHLYTKIIFVKVRFIVGLHNLKDLFQSKWVYKSTKLLPHFIHPYAPLGEKGISLSLHFDKLTHFKKLWSGFTSSWWKSLMIPWDTPNTHQWTCSTAEYIHTWVKHNSWKKLLIVRSLANMQDIKML